MYYRNQDTPITIIGYATFYSFWLSSARFMNLDVGAFYIGPSGKGPFVQVAFDRNLTQRLLM